MPPRLPENIRAAIPTDIRNGNLSARAIARKHGVAQSTVSLIARENAEMSAFDRTKTEAATRAKQAGDRAPRAQLASDLLEDA